MGIGRPSVYASISQSQEFESATVQGSRLKVCRLVGETTPEYPAVETLKTPAWKHEVERALQRLNVDDIDICLFQLGRQFDVAMKALVNTVSNTGKIPVSDGNNRNLKTRIDWAVKHGLLPEAHKLDFLREERNERAHGEAPPLDVRQRMMRDAAFLVGIYVTQLTVIEDRIEEISGRQA